MRTGAIKTAQRIGENPKFEPWREAALARGYRSTIAIPLQYRNMTYGVLCVYAPRPDAFDQTEHKILADLGETIGYAISSVEKRRALMTDIMTELEFQLRDQSVGFIDLSAQAEREVTVDSVVPDSKGTIVVFLTVEGADTDTVLDIVAEDSETETTVVADHGEGTTFRLVGSEPSIAGVVADQDGIVREASADTSDGQVVIELPQYAGVRAVVDGINERYERTKLLPKHERDRSEPIDRTAHSALDETLTDRQREVLRVAYISGFLTTAGEHRRRY